MLVTLGRGLATATIPSAQYLALVKETALSSLVTFTRNSPATYIDSAGTRQTAPIHEPRFDYDSTTGALLAC